MTENKREATSEHFISSSQLFMNIRNDLNILPKHFDLYRASSEVENETFQTEFRGDILPRRF